MKRITLWYGKQGFAELQAGKVLFSSGTKSTFVLVSKVCACPRQEILEYRLGGSTTGHLGDLIEVNSEMVLSKYLP